MEIKSGEHYWWTSPNGKKYAKIEVLSYTYGSDLVEAKIVEAKLEGLEVGDIVGIYPDKLKPVIEEEDAREGENDVWGHTPKFRDVLRDTLGKRYTVEDRGTSGFTVYRGPDDTTDDEVAIATTRDVESIGMFVQIYDNTPGESSRMLSEMCDLHDINYMVTFS